MVKLIMGVGLPGSGKTTVLKALAEKYNFAYVSPDDIRLELHGNAADQSAMDEVWKRVHEKVAEALHARKNVIVDATFYKQHERRAFIKFAKEQGAERVYGAFADVGIEIADQRNQKRSRVVPRPVLERMNRALQEHPPTTEDGFESVNDFAALEELIQSF